MKKQWHMLQPDPDVVRDLIKALNCSPVTASVLANRRISSVEEACRFFRPSLKNMRAPTAFTDMDTAVERIYRAIVHQEKILIFGDYDVDGITSTAALMEFLQYAGARVSYYIPHRIKEGYGLKLQHITGFTVSNDINLIITADCGSGSHEAVDEANRKGIDVIITDHHDVSDPPPRATAFINPKRSDCTSGLCHLAGVGVVFYLIIGLRKFMRDADFWQNLPEPNLKNICDIVALGTVADAVPLVDENRIITAAGLGVIQSGSSRPGIQALLELCKVAKTGMHSDDISFKLAPRLNAAGRIGHAKIAVELLLSDTSTHATQIARTLNKMNFERKETEKEILREIQSYLNDNSGTLEHHCLVLDKAKWHLGVLGIVASRLVDRYYRPVVLISTENGVGKASARSIPGFNLFEALCQCADTLEEFGGHAMAAGFSIDVKNIERFRDTFDAVIASQSRLTDRRPKLFIDHEIRFNEISEHLINEIHALQPFGAENPEPLFLAKNVNVLSSKIVGEHHRRMMLKQATGGQKCFTAIWFNVDEHTASLNHFDQMAFKLQWNRWNGKQSPQLLVEAVSSN